MSQFPTCAFQPGIVLCRQMGADLSQNFGVIVVQPAPFRVCQTGGVDTALIYRGQVNVLKQSMSPASVR